MTKHSRPKVSVIGRDLSESMFLKRGWELVNLLGGEAPDLIQFTGGEDVDPALYGHARHGSTQSNPRRDSYEAGIYHANLGQVAFAGICRGGQLLNVLNGGTMYQHVDNHGGDHIAYDHINNKEVLVTSTHHQMMIPGNNSVLLMSAKRSKVRWLEQEMQLVDREKGDLDVEALFYPATNTLCFQPHPEYLSIGDEGQEIYFDYLKTFFNLG